MYQTEEQTLIRKQHNNESELVKVPFYGVSRGIAKFGLLVSGSCSLTMVARLFPQFRAVYVIVMTLILIAGLGAVAIDRDDTGKKLLIGVLLICIFSGVAIGSWDLMISLFSDSSLFAVQLAVVAAFMTVASTAFTVFFKLGGNAQTKKEESHPWM